MMLLSPRRYGVKVGIDPYASSLISLLHFNGNLTDETGKIWEENASALTSFSTGKFSQAVDFALNNASAYTFRTTTPVAVPIGTGDYTMEFWFRTPDTWLSFNRNLCSITADTSGLGVYVIIRSISAINNYFEFHDGGAGFGASALPLPVSTWFHVAQVRASGVLYFFIDGVLQGTDTSGLNIANPATLYVGANGAGSWFAPYGKMDDFRLTGVARYTSNFTPPTAEFPNP